MGTHTEHLPRIRNSVTEPRSRPGTEPRSPHSRRSDLSTAGCRPCEHEDLMETYGPNMEIPPNHPSDKFSIEIESHGDLGIPISKPKKWNAQLDSMVGEGFFRGGLYGVPTILNEKNMAIQQIRT